MLKTTEFLGYSQNLLKIFKTSLTVSPNSHLRIPINMLIGKNILYNEVFYNL